MKIFDLFEGSSFRLDNGTYTIREFKGDMAVCEREDGRLVYLHGWEVTDEWRGRRTFREWFSQYSPVNL